MTLAPPGGWRAMALSDVPVVHELARIVHPSFPEDEAVFAERLVLFPQGCLVLPGADGLQGYMISHPYPARAVPKLNARLGAIPDGATVYYIHDLALSRATRGLRQGAAIAQYVKAIACGLGFADMALVAVNGSERFWHGQGFRAVEDAALAQALLGYGADAQYMFQRLS
ncbi:GNAT family N-acetyltransferase [Methylovirgula sp. 4M-Z18]|uniref:GNAT family N-acetyltransferase n=1 Tax=Methylovirgula sp. 4M-Z18 TaxID=2293567 RepID=UPI000E2EA20E|nr:GNAT family N-acetyltransferase [Methylovirgula sp. 4M-Z18]RFB78421.1 GNAT family N-acetyltransferase [Methylovirgula sp. 4M-Z18]